MEVTSVPTTKHGDAEEMAQSLAAEYDLVVCVGGDGTLNEVVTGLMRAEKQPRVGYIPTGTTNDFSATLKLPNSVIKAGKRIIDGQTIHLDVGCCGDRSFVYIASFGTLSSVAFTTPQNKKNKIGRIAYFIEGIKLLIKAQPRHVRIVSDGGVFEDDFLFGAVSNSTSIAGFIKLNEDSVSLDDGVFEVTLIKSPKNITSFFHIAKCILWQKDDEAYINRFQASEMEVFCDEGLEWCLDGEDGGVHKHMTIRNRHKSLALIV